MGKTNEHDPAPDQCDDTPAEKRKLPAHALRALAEAAARRARRDANDTANPAKQELGGRNGPDPARYGDWEKKGIASDF